MLCFTSVSCPMGIQFMISPPLLRLTLLHVGPIGVEMYSVPVVRIVLGFLKRSKPVLHSFHIRCIFVLCWIFGFMFQIRSYTGNKIFC